VAYLYDFQTRAALTPRPGCQSATDAESLTKGFIYDHTGKIVFVGTY